VKQKKELEQLISLLLANGYALTVSQQDKLYGFLELLSKHITRQNLVSKADQDILVKKHFVDSCVFCDTLKSIKVPLKKSLKIVDVGTGAGFPGIIISIILGINIVLIDSNRKKALFLKKASRELGLDLDVVNERVGVFAGYTDSQFDIVTARAVTALTDLVLMTGTLLKKSGILITLKGIEYNDEIVSPFDTSMFVSKAPKCYLSGFSNHLTMKKIILYRNIYESRF